MSLYENTLSDEGNRQDPFSLQKIVSVDTVRARQSSSSWEEAVEQVGELLVHAGKIDTSYIDAIKRVFQEMGPYAVIAPGIVLLHASPEEGVLKPCIGVMTLSEPINFGHSENDPVDIVIAFGAVDKKAHITALKTLAELLGKQENLEKIRSAMNDEELLSVLLEET